MLTQAGLEAYLEWARNDYSPTWEYLVRYPFHAQGYTLGLRKALSFGDGTRRGEFLVEITNLELSRDYWSLNGGAAWGGTTFYSHGVVTQGYTNEGQILGAGIGTGGNSQYLGFTLYDSRASYKAYIQRINRDDDYVYFKLQSLYDWAYNAELTVGTQAKYWIEKWMLGSLGIDYCLNLNPLYNPTWRNSSIINNFRFSLGFSTYL